MGFGQFAATTQFFLYGKRHFTSSGWKTHKANYAQPDMGRDLLTTELDLKGQVFIVTGANSGIGKEIAQFLATKGATLYMICRSKERAEAARGEIVEAAAGPAADTRRCWDEFCAHRMKEGPLQLEAILSCTYLLGTLAMPCLEATPESRLVVVSSGGMYNTAFPKWEDATCTGPRQTGGQSWLQPLRNLWQGAEGIIWHLAGRWLLLAEASKLESGAFYLDREPQVKHMAGGPFFTEGSATKNSPGEVADMMRLLEARDWANGRRDSATRVASAPLTAMEQSIDAWPGVFIPLRLKYLVVDCAEDYSTTIIGVPDRRYLWIMARTPQIEESKLDALIAKSRSLGGHLSGFDDKQIVRVPQEVVISQL
eukprot:Skav214304  [mRNA]  locus=scaffold4614:94925:110792:- [translate_table: standard]